MTKDHLQLHHKDKGTTKWVEKTRKDVIEIGINPTEIWNEELF